MSGEPQTPARARYVEAMRDAAATVEQLVAANREDRAAGLAVVVDIGTSAAFMFMVNDRAYEDAANVIRQAIEQATRP